MGGARNRSFISAYFLAAQTYKRMRLTLYTREITRGNSCNTIKLLASDIHVRVLETMPFYLSLCLFDDVLTRSETGEGSRYARPWILTAPKPWSP